MRPIVDFRNSPTYNLVKYLAEVLKIVAKDHETTLKNSYQMADDLKALIIPTDHHMVSFDVVSLFTNVPISETL